MYTFDNLPVAVTLGSRELTLTEDLMDAWLRLFPEDRNDGRMPAGMVAVVSIRAYADVVAPRPPGNVHGAQRFEIVKPPRIGERLVTAVACRGKEIKRDRRWVHLATDTVGDDGTPRFRGHMTILWAA
ncbi:MAG TPA: hypothetical protein VD978_04075 [Azospirillum sp.]|nr:hypothetical protein [Azospirillum sp.]